MSIILASQSPRRRELMEKAGFEIEIRPSDADENIEFNGNPGEYVCKLAEIKGDAVKSDKGDIVLSADTIVTIDGEILGKPHSPMEAVEMLRKLSSRTHSVYTGCCIRKDEGKEIFYEKSDVTFFELSDEEIQSYVASGEPFDKAGGYGIQGKGCILVEKIVGDYYNIVGLPIAKVYQYIKKEIES